jgi:hypothetical protein
MFSERARTVQLCSKCIIWMYLNRESIMDVEQLHEWASVTNLAEPRFSNSQRCRAHLCRFLWRCVREESCESSAAPDARDESRRNQSHACTTVSAAALRPPLPRLESLRRRGRQS